METLPASFVPERFTQNQAALLVILVLLAPWLWRQAQVVLWRAANVLHYDWGASRAARLLLGLVRRLPVAASAHSSLARTDIYIQEALGETQAAVAGARGLTAHARADGCWACANCAANVFINAGLYLEALELEKGDLRTEDEPNRRLEHLLVRFNLVEAVYNLGGWTAASKRLEQLKEEARLHPLVWNFYPIQSAWILAHTGRGEEALEVLESVYEEQVPYPYRSELYFTRAAALLAVKRYEDAHQAARRGIELARRASSQRNGLFMQGRIALAAGHSEKALRFFETGARHRYQGQGGDALLAWGDELARLGRLDEAGKVWRLILERDPQSGAAWEAAARLRTRARS